MTLVENVKRTFIEIEDKMMDISVVLTKKKSTREISNRERETRIISSAKPRAVVGREETMSGDELIVVRSLMKKA